MKTCGIMYMLTRKALFRKLMSIPRSERLIFCLHFSDGLSTETISYCLNLPEDLISASLSITKNMLLNADRKIYSCHNEASNTVDGMPICSTCFQKYFLRVDSYDTN